MGASATSSLTRNRISNRKGDWKSYLYQGMDTESEYIPSTSFRLWFVGERDTKEVMLTGRNLERIYTLCLQGRMEWLRVAGHDYAKNKEMIILKIDVRNGEETREKKSIDARSTSDEFISAGRLAVASVHPNNICT